MRRRPGVSSLMEQIELSARWRQAVRSHKAASDRGHEEYPRWRRLYDIVQADGRVKLMMNYSEQNPNPDLKNHGERRQVESLLSFERPLDQLKLEAEGRWRVGDYEGEAELLEEYAKSNPQHDAIIGLAAEARRDALSGASTRVKPKRR